ncbi:reverse transcriptase [Cucumis melo var. makuwa]|uniref:Reverse transcriptase n=1 Tax=Cucumis melo var. makuwa TaxID=1194695 RepID=A0A5A7V3Z5_CUCMM|nr:reverse transcriptase [Cucumis melo var. makuwa]
MVPPVLAELRKQLDELLNAWFIRPVKASYGASVLFQKKKDESLRLCIDYRTLNKLTTCNKYPLPIITDFLIAYMGQSIFRNWTCGRDTTKSELPRETSLRQPVFHEYLDKFVVVYLDGIMVYSTTMEEHRDHLQKVFQKLKENQLYVKREKFSFAQERINFLFHVIECGRIEMKEGKIAAICDWAVPKPVSELRSFLGQYLLGSSFVVKTNNSATCHFFTQPKLTSKQARWQKFSVEFDIEFEHKKGSRNQADDALSGKHEHAVICLLAHLRTSKTQQFWVEEDLLITKGNQLYVPRVGELRKKLLYECHDTLWAGHPGWQQTRESEGCRTSRPSAIPTRPWESVSMDFITYLLKVGDFEAILVIIDRLSKYVTFISTTKQCSAEMTAQLFFKHVIKLWGVPTSLVSDRDGRFIGSFWMELFTFLGTSLNISSSYHPQTDDQTERFNCMLKEYLRHFINIVSGRQPVLPHLVDHPYVGKNPQTLNFTKEWKQINDIARGYLEKASRQMKKWVDKKRRPLEFRAGDQILIKLRLEQIRFRGRKDQRLIKKYEGPVKVLKKVGNTSYKVALPISMKIYPVIHVSNLKPHHQDTEDLQQNVVTHPIINLSHKEDKDVEEMLVERPSPLIIACAIVGAPPNRVRAVLSRIPLEVELRAEGSWRMTRSDHGKIPPRRGSHRGGRRGRGVGHTQPEQQPTVQAANSTAAVTQANFTTMEKRYQDMLRDALAPFHVVR